MLEVLNMIDVLNRGEMQSLLHLLQLLAQSLLHCCYRHACMCACHSVHVAGCVVNCTRQVLCTQCQQHLTLSALNKRAIKEKVCVKWDQRVWKDLEPSEFLQPLYLCVYRGNVSICFLMCVRERKDGWGFTVRRGAFPAGPAVGNTFGSKLRHTRRRSVRFVFWEDQWPTEQTREHLRVISCVSPK